MTNEQLLEQVKTGQHLVKFYATWCGPCKIAGKAINNIKSQREDLNVIELDAEQEQELVKEFQVKNLPTLLFYKDGELTEKLVGTVTAMKIYEALEK